MDGKTSHLMAKHGFLPGLGHAALTPFYDLRSRFSGVGGLFDEMIRLADVQPGQRALDVGCGTGNLLVALGRRHPDVDLSGIDPDTRMLAAAARKARRKVVAAAWQRGFGQDLPYPDGTFDRVFSSLMLHHLDPQAKEALLAGVRRVLRPDGMFVLADLDGHGAVHGHGPMARRMADSGLIHDNAGMAERVAAAGFTVEPVTTFPLRMGAMTIVRARP